VALLEHIRVSPAQSPDRRRRFLISSPTAGGKLREKVESIGSAIRSRTLRRHTDLTENALNFLPPLERAQIWARFGDLNRHDASKVEPVREIAETAKVNGDWANWFAETALVNSRHEQRKPFSVSLGRRPDGQARVKDYLTRKGHTAGPDEARTATFVDKAARIIEEHPGLDPDTAANIAEKFRTQYSDVNFTNLLIPLAVNMARDAARSHATSTDSSDNSVREVTIPEHSDGTETIIESRKPREVIFSV
jgi:hypothetical protein